MNVLKTIFIIIITFVCFSSCESNGRHNTNSQSIEAEKPEEIFIDFSKSHFKGPQGLSNPAYDIIIYRPDEGKTTNPLGESSSFTYSYTLNLSKKEYASLYLNGSLLFDGDVYDTIGIHSKFVQNISSKDRIFICGIDISSNRLRLYSNLHLQLIDASPMPNILRMAIPDDYKQVEFGKMVNISTKTNYLTGTQSASCYELPKSQFSKLNLLVNFAGECNNRYSCDELGVKLGFLGSEYGPTIDWSVRNKKSLEILFGK